MRRCTSSYVCSYLEWVICLSAVDGLSTAVIVLGGNWRVRWWNTVATGKPLQHFSACDETLSSTTWLYQELDPLSQSTQNRAKDREKEYYAEKRGEQGMLSAIGYKVSVGSAGCNSPLLGAPRSFQVGITGCGWNSTSLIRRSKVLAGTVERFPNRR